MNWTMEAVYSTAGISKQAHNQYMIAQQEFNEKLSLLVLEADMLRSEHPGCGVEKMYQTLKPDWLGRDKFIELFMDLGYRIKYPRNYTRTTVPGHLNYPNLITGLLVRDINRVWQSDITYYYTSEDGYCYLVFIIDIYTKEIIGYAVSGHMRAEANIQALKMAFKHNKGLSLDELIHHSDRGSQYGSNDYTELLRQKGIWVSMGLEATDNAYAERLNGTVKNEYLKYFKINNLKELKRRTSSAVRNYNYKRVHNHLPGRVPPATFRKTLLTLSDRNRPAELVYADGNYKLRKVSNLSEFRPEIEPTIHVCPIVIS
jgi:transposase InsO family protein